MSDLTDNLSDGALASEDFSFINETAISQSATVSDSFTFIVIPGGVLIERATATDSMSVSIIHGLSFSSSATASDSLRLSMPASITDSARASETWAATGTSHAVETARASEAWVVNATRNAALTQHAVASDHFALYDAKSLTESATATDSFEITYIAGVHITETAFVSDAIGDRRAIFASMVETAFSHDQANTNFVWRVSLGDLVVAHAEFELSGTDTTWVINTRTNAITQYNNFKFNSFAGMGRKFIAARSDGLFELNGARDDPNVNILATLGSGFAQMNGGKQAGLKGAYLGVRGQGVYELKFVAGDGRSWTYRRLSNPGLMTTKFNIGKGLHSRYLAWELSNYDGQDFDLDSVELVPMMSGRRIG